MNDEEIIDKWLEALESGKYSQTQRMLNFENGFCCLGVLADVQGVDWERDNIRNEGDEFLREDYACGIAFTQQHLLANLNDSGVSFAEIAAEIRRKRETGELFDG